MTRHGKNPTKTKAFWQRPSMQQTDHKTDHLQTDHKDKEKKLQSNTIRHLQSSTMAEGTRGYNWWHSGHPKKNKKHHNQAWWYALQWHQQPIKLWYGRQEKNSTSAYAVVQSRRNSSTASCYQCKKYSHINGYKIISLQNITGKLIEKILASRLAWALEQHRVSPTL